MGGKGRSEHELQGTGQRAAVNMYDIVNSLSLAVLALATVDM